jgi:hypothetical protein
VDFTASNATPNYSSSDFSSSSNSTDTMPLPPLKTVRFAFKTARIAGKVITLGLRIQRARRGRGC